MEAPLLKGFGLAFPHGFSCWLFPRSPLGCCYMKRDVGRVLSSTLLTKSAPNTTASRFATPLDGPGSALSLPPSH